MVKEFINQKTTTKKQKKKNKKSKIGNGKWKMEDDSV